MLSNKNSVCVRRRERGAVQYSSWRGCQDIQQPTKPGQSGRSHQTCAGDTAEVY